MHTIRKKFSSDFPLENREFSAASSVIEFDDAGLGGGDFLTLLFPPLFSSPPPHPLPSLMYFRGWVGGWVKGVRDPC